MAQTAPGVPGAGLRDRDVHAAVGRSPRPVAAYFPAAGDPSSTPTRAVPGRPPGLTPWTVRGLREHVAGAPDSDVRAEIELVVIDPSAPYAADIRTALPGARIAVDKWHLVDADWDGCAIVRTEPRVSSVEPRQLLGGRKINGLSIRPSQESRFGGSESSPADSGFAGSQTAPCVSQLERTEGRNASPSDLENHFLSAKRRVARYKRKVTTPDID